MTGTFKTHVTDGLIRERKGYEEKVEILWFFIKKKLKSSLFRYFYFHVVAFSLMLVETGIFLSACIISGKTFLPAFVLACFFLTFFGFLILRLYLRSRKPEIRQSLSELYLNKVKEIIGYKENSYRHQILLASAAQSLAVRLQDWEYALLQSWSFFIRAPSFLRKVSGFCFWKDVVYFRENLLERAVDLHLNAVKKEPIDLKAHASLADAFVLLSGLYADPRKYPEFEGEDWIPETRYSNETRDKFRNCAERAIEEFKILNDYFPGNTWVHTQLAYSYHDLQMPEEEISQYEILLNLRPSDEDIMFKLGMLYFRQGMNSSGLRIYEILKKINYNKSQKLINFYGSFFIY